MKIEKKDGVVIIDTHKDIEKGEKLLNILDRYYHFFVVYRKNKKKGFPEKIWVSPSNDVVLPKDIRAFYREIDSIIKNL